MIYEPSPAGPDAVSGLVGAGRSAGVRAALLRRRSRGRRRRLRRTALDRGRAVRRRRARPLGRHRQRFLRWRSARWPRVRLVGHLEPRGGAVRRRDPGGGHADHHRGRHGARWCRSGSVRPTFLSELAPRWMAAPLSTLIDLLAAVPSIVVGLWGLLVLTPVFASHVEPFLPRCPSSGWLFGGDGLRPQHPPGLRRPGRHGPATGGRPQPHGDRGGGRRRPRGGHGTRRHQVAGGPPCGLPSARPASARPPSPWPWAGPSARASRWLW